MTRTIHRYLLGLVLGLGVFGGLSRGDVFEWEYIDPLDPSQGKQQSSTLAPGGAGANLDSILGLTSRNLTKAYLFGANIPQFRVSSSILDDAYLAEANMFNLQGDQLVARGADMSRANLQRARLVNANLDMATLAGANLTEAYLTLAMLSGADFTDAVVIGARLGNTTAKGFTAQQLYQTRSYQDKNLVGMELSQNDLRGWDFTNQDLSQANFSSSQLDGANFTDSLVTEAIFDRSDLSASQLYSTLNYQNRQLDRIQLNGMNLSTWDFSNQSLMTARINSSNLTNTTFDGANLTQAQLQPQDFELMNDTSFRGANLTNARFGTNTRWGRTDFTGANLTGANLVHSRFVDSKLDDATISGTQFSDVGPLNFTLADIYSTASYKAGDLRGLDIERGELSGAIFQGMDLSMSRLVQLNLTGADFRGATVVEAYLGGTLEGADFRGANLTDATLSFEPLTRIDFRGANLTGVHFSNTSLVNVDLSNAIVFGARFVRDNGPGDLTSQQLYSTASYQTGMLGPIQLEGDLRGWDFRGQDLSGGRFERESQLQGALWEGATLVGTIFFVNPLPDTDFRLADVRQAEFIASNLDRSDFRGTDLTDASFEESSLKGASFDEANLTGAYLGKANLESASYINANLRDASFSSVDSFLGTDFRGAEIRGADFNYAMDYGFTLDQLRSTSSFRQQDLSGVNLQGSRLPGFDFSGFRLVGTGLSDAALEGAKFNGSDLTGATFRYAKLTDADFTDSVVRKANFYGALQGGFTRAMLESTTSYKLRKLDGIDVSSSDLKNWDFRGQDLREASFRFSDLQGTRFDLADLRGARFSSLPTGGGLLDMDFQRAILPDGTLTLLDVSLEEVLTIRSEPTLQNYTLDTSRDPPTQSIPPSGVKVKSSTSQIQGTLEILLGEGEWKSTVIFPRRASVSLGGFLRLDFDELIDPSQAIGKSFALFSWPTLRGGEFQVFTQPNQIWDLSNLYTTGMVQLLAIVPEPSALLLACFCSFTAAMRCSGRLPLRMSWE